jgi:hypothetical protein
VAAEQVFSQDRVDAFLQGVSEPGSLVRELRRLRAELAATRLALEYYANEDNWQDDDWGCRSVIQGDDYARGGKTAREALAAFPQTQDVVE